MSVQTLTAPSEKKLYKVDKEDSVTFICHTFFAKKNVLQGSHFPVSFSMEGYDTINYEGKNRKIRYIPGEASVFAHEQSDPTPEADAKCKSIRFTDGKLQVYAQDSALMDFLKLTNHNFFKQNRMPGAEIFFMPWQPDLKSEENVGREKLITKAMNVLWEMAERADGFHQIKSYAEVLNIKGDDSRIQELLVAYIRKNPQDFIDGVNSDKMKMKYYIKKAIDYAILYLDTQQNSIGWTGAGAITVAPPGQDVVDYLVEQSSERLKTTFDAIKTKVNEAEAINRVKVPVKVPEPTLNTPPSDKRGPGAPRKY